MSKAREALPAAPGNRLALALPVLVLALGIGIATALFAVVDTVLWRPLPIRDVDSIFAIWETYATPGGPRPREQFSVSHFTYGQWRRHSTAFSLMAALEVGSFNLTGGEGEPERLGGAVYTPEMLDVLGVRPVAGRNFLPAEARPGAPPVCLVGYSLWQRRFHQDPALVGRTLTVDGVPRRVVGILPPGYYHPFDSEIWVPMQVDFAHLGESDRTLRTSAVWGRLRPDRTPEQALAELRELARRLEREHPDTHLDWSVDLVPLPNELLGDFRPRLQALLAAGVLVFLLAVGGAALFAWGRTVRSGGAPPPSLAASLLLALLAGATGFGLAAAFTRRLVDVSPLTTLTRLFREVHFDLRVALVTAALCLLAAGLWRLPALAAARRGGHGGEALPAALAAAGVAVAVALLIGAGLMLRTFRNVGRVDQGFDPASTLTVRFTLPASRYPTGVERVRFYERVLEQVRALPGVRGAGVTTDLPLTLHSRDAAFLIEGRPAGDEPLVTSHRMVSAGYLEALGLRLLEGRTFTAADSAASEPVAVISRGLARFAWPGEDPLGKRLGRARKDAERPWVTVVGVVDDVQENYRYPKERFTWYLPYTQYDDAVHTALVVRTEGEPLDLEQQVRAIVHRIDPEQPVYQISTLERLVHFYFVKPRFWTFLLAILAGSSALAAAVGLYGLAAGSRPRVSGTAAAAGLLAGLAAALLLAGRLSPVLHGVSPRDPATFAIIALGCALAAGIVLYLGNRPAARFAASLRPEGEAA